MDMDTILLILITPSYFYTSVVGYFAVNRIISGESVKAIIIIQIFICIIFSVYFYVDKIIYRSYLDLLYVCKYFAICSVVSFVQMVVGWLAISYFLSGPIGTYEKLKNYKKD